MLNPVPVPGTLPEPRYHAKEPPRAPAPVEPVAPRPQAITSPAELRVMEAAAVKVNTFPSRPGYPSGSTHWQTHLHVETWVRNTAFEKHVWADVHVYGHDGALVASQSCAMAYERPAGDGGDVFRLDCAVYEGTTATPGSTTARPDVRLVEFRVYAELAGRLLTDGESHGCTLRPDVASH